MPLDLKEPRKGKTPYWYVRGTYLGRYVNRSTGVADKTTARKILKEIQREIERGRFDAASGPTFLEASYRYQRETQGAGRFIEKLNSVFANVPVSSITQEMIEDAAHILYPDCTNATRNRAVFTPVSAILRHAGIDIRLRRPEKANGETRQFWLRPEQAQALIAEATRSDAELGCFMLFLLYTGCRLSEALRMTADDVDITNASALIPMTKNGEPRTVHLPPVVVAALANHPRGLRKGERVFRYHAGGKFNRRLHDLAERAGTPFPRGVGFHGFRHTFGALMRRYAGLDTTGLVATGAWKSHEAARRYEHAVTSEEAQRADLLPDVTGGLRVDMPRADAKKA